MLEEDERPLWKGDLLRDCWRCGKRLRSTASLPRLPGTEIPDVFCRDCRRALGLTKRKNP